MAGGMRKIKLGSQGLEVSALGLGCLGMSAGYGPPKPEEDMIKLIHYAVNSGVTHLDTSDFYGPYTNEILIGKALKGLERESVQLATKFGIKSLDGKGEMCGDPEYVRACCEASLKRLDVDYIDLYYIHRVDPRVPIEITMGEMKKLVEEGKIKYVGLSEASPSTIRRAHAVHPITALQLDWSLWTRVHEEEVIPTCRELGIGIVPYGPLGSGFLASGPKLLEGLTDSDFRKMGEVKKLVEEGKIKYVGLSEASPSTIGRAHAVHPITAVQLEWSLWTRVHEEKVIPTCRELGIGIVPYAPLGSGFFASGPKVLEGLTGFDYRQYFPRFQGDNLEHNKILFDRLHEIAQNKGCTPSQLALAWILNQGSDVGPIPGTTKIENLNQNIESVSVNLSLEDMNELKSIASMDAFKGSRLPPEILAHSNVETPPLSSWK